MSRGRKPLDRLPRVRVLRGVPRYAAESVRSAVRSAATVISVRHRLDVLVVPAPVVGIPPDEVGWACFVPAERRIYVGGLGPRIWKRHGSSHHEALEQIRRDVFHELVHYEQWRDGITPHHRGIDRRVEALIRRSAS